MMDSALVLDVHGRRIVGWSMARHLRTEPLLERHTGLVVLRWYWG